MRSGDPPCGRGRGPPPVKGHANGSTCVRVHSLHVCIPRSSVSSCAWNGLIICISSPCHNPTLLRRQNYNIISLVAFVLAQLLQWLQCDTCLFTQGAQRTIRYYTLPVLFLARWPVYPLHRRLVGLIEVPARHGETFWGGSTCPLLYTAPDMARIYP